MAPTHAFGFGTAFAPGFTVWPTFVWSPQAGNLLRGMTIKPSPGVVLYDWVPTDVSIELAALGAVSTLPQR